MEPVGWYVRGVHRLPAGPLTGVISAERSVAGGEHLVEARGDLRDRIGQPGCCTAACITHGCTATSIRC